MKRSLLKLFISSLSIRLIVYLFGPYDYSIESYEGVLYMCFVDLFFALGLMGYGIKRINVTTTTNDDHSSIDIYENRILITFELISILLFLLWLIDWQRNIGFQYIFSSEDVRRLVSEKRTTISKLAEFCVPMGVIPFLATQSNEEYTKSLSKRISLITLWLPGVITFASGARWGIVLCIALFIIKYREKNANSTEKKYSIKRIIFTTIIIIILSYIISYIISLFALRGVKHGENVYLLSPGDMKIKNIWRVILNKSYSTVEPLYGFSTYIAQPIPVFSYVYKNWHEVNAVYGLNMFRVVPLILSSLGLSSFSVNDIYSNNFSGLYTSYIYGYIVDWGYYVTPIFVFITGLLFSKIEKLYITQNKHSNLYPLIKAMVLFAPYYYFFQVGSMDFILMWLLIFSFLNRHHFTVGKA